VGRGWGIDAAKRVEQYPNSLTLVVCTDDEEAPDNRVTIADDWGADENGPVPKVTYHPTARSQERQDWLARKGSEILRAAGARTVHRTNVQPAYFTHIMGTLRMGADPATSVADAGCEAHQVTGLFVGDSSALPNGLGGPNPTLTLQALAARTAEQIALRYFESK
jgi:choline dehydrogenase-like flavoprotein